MQSMQVPFRRGHADLIFKFPSRGPGDPRLEISHTHRLAIVPPLGQAASGTASHRPAGRPLQHRPVMKATPSSLVFDPFSLPPSPFAYACTLPCAIPYPLPSCIPFPPPNPTPPSSSDLSVHACPPPIPIHIPSPPHFKSLFPSSPSPPLPLPSPNQPLSRRHPRISSHRTSTSCLRQLIFPCGPSLSHC